VDERPRGDLRRFEFRCKHVQVLPVLRNCGSPSAILSKDHTYNIWHVRKKNFTSYSLPPYKWWGSVAELTCHLQGSPPIG
jgi:hypothetical protein